MSRVTQMRPMQPTEMAVEHYSGYKWVWVQPLGEWVLKWFPVAGTYSPPVFDTTLSWYHMTLPPRSPMRDTSRRRAFLQKHRRHGLAYLYYRDDLEKMEIWSKDVAGTVIAILAEH